MPTPIISYPLDPTGLSPNNKIINEPKTLPNRLIRAAATNYGAFYTESLVVKDVTNNRILTRGISYEPAELFEILSEIYLKEIHSVILITDPTVSSNISISYQCVGGEYSTSSEAIVSMLTALSIDDRPADYNQLINLPNAFQPAMHLHDVGDVYGFEYLVNALERLTSAILTGDNASHDRIYTYINNLLLNNSGNSEKLDEEYFLSQL